MNARRLRLILTRAASVAAVLVMLLSLPTAAAAAASSPFTGQWTATDVDGSNMSLAIGGPAQGPFQITWTDDYIGSCQGEPGIIRGTGALNPDDVSILDADLKLDCFQSGEELELHFAFRFHAATNTLSLRYPIGSVVVWQHPGKPLPPPPAFNLRVNYGDNWVESFYEEGHTVWVTVTESDGRTPRAILEAVTEPKWYWGGESGFTSLDSGWLNPDGSPMDGQPDIQPNDWVFGWVDNGASAEVQIGAIVGEIDLVANNITGTVSAPWFSEQVSVECLDWSSHETPLNNQDYGPIMPDGTDTYTCSWGDEWDVAPGEAIGVGYFGPDGNWVSRPFVAATFGAYLPSAVEGYDWPLDKTVTLYINGAYTATAVSEQRDGGTHEDTRVLFELWRDGLSFGAGDHITLTDGVITKDTYVSDLAVTNIDPAARTVSGIFDPDYGNIWVWIYGTDGQVPDIDGSNWTATLHAMLPGVWGGATQWEADGDATSLDFQVPAIYTITSTEDVVADDGVCTLREAVIAANTNTPSGASEGECFGGVDELTDIIRLLPETTYSLTIDSTDEGAALDGDLDIWDNGADPDLVLEVAGDGAATVSQDAAVDDRVFENFGGRVVMSGLVVTGGGNTAFGAGILNGGNLQLNGSEVTGNASGGVGGGIASYGDGLLTVDNSRIINNYSTSDGGGIMNWGSATVTSSTISNNTTDHNGGGIASEGTLVVDASTVAANIASGGTGGGGGLSILGTTTIQNGSVIGGDPEAGQGNQGGGIINFGELLVQDSQVTGNSAEYAAGIANWGGTVTVSHSEVSFNSATASAGGIHNKDGGMLIVRDGSSIIANTTASDGGGINNWDGTVTIENSTVSENTARGSGGGINNLWDGTLVAEGSLISENSANNGAGIANWGGSVSLTESTLEGNSADWAAGIFTFGGTVGLNATSVSGNTSLNDGGGIQIKNGAAVTIENGSSIANNRANYGAGIANWYGTLVVDASIVTGNTATSDGGGLLNKDDYDAGGIGRTTIQNGSELSGNAGSYGGAIANWGSAELVIDSSTISGNHAESGTGGGISAGGTVTVTNSIFQDNTSVVSGGAIWVNETGRTTISGSTFAGNQAPWGGAVFEYRGGETSIADSVFSGNIAEYNGGALFNLLSKLTLSGSAVVGNTAGAEGGAIYSVTDVPGDTTVTAGCIAGNTSGGLYAVFNQSSALQTFTGNWWGDPSGPGGEGTGSGDSVSPYIDFGGWLTEAPAICAGD